MSEFPCRDCKNRKVGCHQGCELYGEAVRQRAVSHAEKVRAYEEAEITFGYRLKSFDKQQKYINRRRRWKP